jgi:hypothetical protein
MTNKKRNATGKKSYFQWFDHIVYFPEETSPCLTTIAAIWVASGSRLSNHVFGVRKMKATINRQKMSYCHVPRS